MFRKHGRTPIRSPLVLNHTKAGRFEVFACDISATGLYVRAEEAQGNQALPMVEIGDQLEAQLESPDNDGPPEMLQLKVTRRAEDGLGLIFV